MVVFEVSSLLKAKCYSSVLVSVLNNWWPSGFMWDRGRERCYMLPASSCVGSLGYLMLSPPQFHNISSRVTLLPSLSLVTSGICVHFSLPRCPFLQSLSDLIGL